MRRVRIPRWLRLAAGLTALALSVAALHAVRTRAGGMAGRIWARNVAARVNASALFYTELGDVRRLIAPEHSARASRP